MPAMMARTCPHCGSRNYYLQPESYSSDVARGNLEAVGGFDGYELKCLGCSRPHPDLPEIEREALVLFFAVTPRMAHRARFAAMTFVWHRAKAATHA